MIWRIMTSTFRSIKSLLPPKRLNIKHNFCSIIFFPISMYYFVFLIMFKLMDTQRYCSLNIFDNVDMHLKFY